ncbi:MAG: hypothetical protein HQK95_03610 [Nitrospirae bacterium]|nr:hypothetical protein [Nitrospirota bacterium]
MTILVGVLCKDGIVIGSDSSATFSDGTSPTIEQPCKKVHIIGSDVIVAGAGAVGLSQRFNAIVESKLSGGHHKNKAHIETAKQICAACISDFNSTQAPGGAFGALLAFATNSSFHLCEFDINTLQPEFKTDSLWYVSMGSGQQIADPFLGLIRRVFWKSGPPSLREGIFSVTWTLHHSIEVNPGGVNGPPQIAILQEDPRGHFAATLLDDKDLGEHVDNVKAAERYLADYRNIMHGISDKTIPEPS